MRAPASQKSTTSTSPSSRSASRPGPARPAAAPWACTIAPGKCPRSRSSSAMRKEAHLDQRPARRQQPRRQQEPVRVLIPTASSSSRPCGWCPPSTWARRRGTRRSSSPRPRRRAPRVRQGGPHEQQHLRDPRLPRRTVSAEIRQRLADAIHTGQLAPGTPLPASARLPGVRRRPHLGAQAIQGLVIAGYLERRGNRSACSPSACPTSTSPVTIARRSSPSCSRCAR